VSILKWRDTTTLFSHGDNELEKLRFNDCTFGSRDPNMEHEADKVNRWYALLFYKLLVEHLPNWNLRQLEPQHSDTESSFDIGLIDYIYIYYMA